MAAPSRRTCTFLRTHLGQFLCYRASSQQNSLESDKASVEILSIPRKKTWSKEAVLEALALTVNKDPTAYAYQFQDDPYLSPRSSTDFKLFSLSQASGRAAAKFFVNNHSKFFTKDFAEPPIPCLMPETVAPHLEEVTEEALRERVQLRKVTAAVELYDQLLQTGTAISMETTHQLLDLICFYGDRDPAPEGGPQTEDTEASAEGRQMNKPSLRQASALKSSWKENNNAERIFKLLPERDSHSYCTLIRGMVKHGAPSKAFSLYTDLLNNRLVADVHTFNSLLLAASEVRDGHNDKWDLICDLLKQMNQQKVQPNLQTFNAVLKALKHCGHLARAHALQTISEMKALGIAPSLASYHHLLAVFYKASQNTDILQEVLSELMGRSLECRDPDDVHFFSQAMRICLENKDLDLAYNVQSLVEVGENWRLLGDSSKQNIYYGRFFTLLCMMEHVDVVLKWYHCLVPSLYYPRPQGLMDLLQALDTDNRLEMLPSVWKDIRSLAHDNKADLVEELLTLMAREQHAPEVQERFARCALEIKGVFDGDTGRSGPVWSTSSLSSITCLLLRGNRSQQAWDVLQLFRCKNRVPPEGLLEEFLLVCHDEKLPQRAVELVQFSATFCLAVTQKLARSVLADFDLTEEQRTLLSDLEMSAEPCD
ncbi:small ribosomal subunit protein mS39 [Takifugu rubripes]|uniref:Small ribosomal subunit protein mS39 n=1 Tax=Takifugu rubripes TaxID=31033 RepID=H2SA98_TAKRU|nr:pentatricopeptide repeat domain-containing protein 3, mitochondrial [Takifugu rubripes]